MVQTIEVKNESKIGSFFSKVWAGTKWVVFLPWRIAKGIGMAIIHPIDTIHSMSDGIRGILLIGKALFGGSITNYKGELNVDLDIGSLFAQMALALVVGFYIWVVLLACGVSMALSVGVIGIAFICGTGIRRWCGNLYLGKNFLGVLDLPHEGVEYLARAHFRHMAVAVLPNPLEYCLVGLGDAVVRALVHYARYLNTGQ